MERSLQTMGLLVVVLFCHETYLMHCEELHRAPKLVATLAYYTFGVFAMLVLSTQLFFKITKKEVPDETE